MALPPPQPGSTALITGASAGIGEEFARQLAARGYGVCLVARREDRLRALADGLERQHGIRAEAIAADFEDFSAVEALPAQIAERGLDVEILVNNAGFTTVGDVHANPDRQMGMVRVNVDALVGLTTAFLPAMVERGRGAVVQVASVVSFYPSPVQAVYGATKAFVRSFGEALSSELKGTGVTMTTLCPGPVSTEFLEAGGFKHENPGPSFIWSTPADVAKAGIDGAEHGKRIVIPGLTNRASAFFFQHGPHSLILGPMAAGYRRAIGE